MGNLCGKEAKPAGRRLGDSAPIAARPAASSGGNSQARPTNAKVPKVGGPGRTLTGPGGRSDTDPDDPREAARLAAERRLKAAEGNPKPGSLEDKLLKQKKATPTQTQPRKNDLNDPSAWA